MPALDVVSFSLIVLRAMTPSLQIRRQTWGDKHLAQVTQLESDEANTQTLGQPDPGIQAFDHSQLARAPDHVASQPNELQWWSWTPS